MSITAARVVTSAALVALLAGSALAGPWSQGNLVVLQVGPSQNIGAGAPNLNAVAHAVTLREFAVGPGFSGNDVAINASSTGTRLTVTGSSTSEGAMNLSADNRFLVFGGYDAAQGQSGPNANSSIATSINGTGAGTDVARVVGAVDLAQNVNLNRLTDSYSTNNFRGGASLDGTSFVTNASGNGLRNLTPPATTTSGNSTTILNTRVARFDLGNRLFVSSASGMFFGISEVVAGTATLLPGFPSSIGPSPYDFEFISNTLLYVADDRSVASGGGLQRWTFNGTIWNLQYTIAVTNGLRSIAVTIDALGNNLIYAVTGGASAGGVTNLVSISDTGAGSTVNTLATAASGNLFRSVEFVPVPTPGAAALLGLGGLVAIRRRR